MFLQNSQCFIAVTAEGGDLKVLFLAEEIHHGINQNRMIANDNPA